MKFGRGYNYSIRDKNDMYLVEGALGLPTKADAELIAAAPAMYEALKELVEQLNAMRAADFPFAVMEAHKNARALIARAEGRQS